MDVEFEVRRLRESDDTKNFTNEQPALVDYFRQFAKQNQFKHGASITWVAVRREVPIGYITLVGGSVHGTLLGDERGGLARGHSHPVLLIARLARDLSARGQGIGPRLMIEAFDTARRMREQVGCIGLLVNPKPDSVDFYRAHNFRAVSMPDGSTPEATPMFLAMRRLPVPLEP